ncbi:hypothetical protein CFC21_064648 [Triticum aestivum]|uniref:Uncharacterized protein n=2 Tax=Triticum aestivum TaxID=4565 RepID=A0A3B6KE06_WHEAT|nr:hypothetical protein CFC21_064648 [Triticum aestivum]
MREWESRADEQRRVVADLMRLIGMPEGPVTVASTLLEEEAGAYLTDKESLATPTREIMAAAIESSSS